MDSLFGAKKNLEKMEKQGGGITTPPPSPAKEAPSKFLTQGEKDDLRTRLKTKNKVKVTLRTLVYGGEGTGKSGIVMAHLYHNKKRSMIIDIDGGMEDNLVHYPGAEDFIHVENPTQLGRNEKGQSVVDHIKTFEYIKEILDFVAENSDDYDAIVIDGLSTLWEFASKQVKIDKYITPEGEVDFRFWQIRGDYFLGMLEITRGIKGLDQIFIGHSDMTLVPGKERVVTKKGGVIMINKTPKPIHKLHAMVNQKIFTEKIVNPKAKGGKTTEYKATYQKARPFPELEEEEVVFSTKQGSEVNWTGEKILGAFVRGEKK